MFIWCCGCRRCSSATAIAISSFQKYLNWKSSSSSVPSPFNCRTHNLDKNLPLGHGLLATTTNGNYSSAHPRRQRGAYVTLYRRSRQRVFILEKNWIKWRWNIPPQLLLAGYVTKAINPVIRSSNRAARVTDGDYLMDWTRAECRLGLLLLLRIGDIDQEWRYNSARWN